MGKTETQLKIEACVYLGKIKGILKSMEMERTNSINFQKDFGELKINVSKLEEILIHL
jgi:hypothetical protein